MSDWIDHDGKSQPFIDGDTLVHVKFRDGVFSSFDTPWTARMWGSNWEHDEDRPHDADIVAYKVVS